MLYAENRSPPFTGIASSYAEGVTYPRLSITGISYHLAGPLVPVETQHQLGIDGAKLIATYDIMEKQGRRQ